MLRKWSEYKAKQSKAKQKSLCSCSQMNCRGFELRAIWILNGLCAPSPLLLLLLYYLDLTVIIELTLQLGIVFASEEHCRLMSHEVYSRAM